MTDSKRCAPETQERAKAQKAQAAACQLAAQMIVSNAVKHAILHEQLANAAEAEACRVAARMMVTRAFSTAIHRDEMATLQQVSMMFCYQVCAACATFLLSPHQRYAKLLQQTALS